MGIPFSREINSAFEQVTPLVQAAYETLETTKNIALVLLALQIAVFVTLLLTLLTLVGLLFTMNPDLEKERKLFVTPVMKWMASWAMTGGGYRKSIVAVLVGFFVLVGLGFVVYVYYVRNVEDATIENDPQAGDANEALKKGKDVDAIRKGETKQ